MNFDQKQREELEKLNNALASQSLQYDPKDPYSTDRTLYNPTTGDLYVTIREKNGRIRRTVVNLMGE
jgi:hypothetical protein